VVLVQKALKIFVYSMLLLPFCLGAIIAYLVFFPERGAKPDFLLKLEANADASAIYDLATDECIFPHHSITRSSPRSVVVRKMDDSNGFFYSREQDGERRIYGIFPTEIVWDFERDPRSPLPETYCGSRLSFAKTGRYFTLVSASSKP
jgi:hypothetical protein